MTRPAETLKLRIAPETLPARPSVVAFRAKLSVGIYTFICFEIIHIRGCTCFVVVVLFVWVCFVLFVFFFLLSLELFTDSCIFPTNYEIFCMKIKSCTCNYSPMFLIL